MSLEAEATSTNPKGASERAGAGGRPGSKTPHAGRTEVSRSRSGAPARYHFTVAGAGRGRVPPSPRSPETPSPQQRALPSASQAQV